MAGWGTPLLIAAVVSVIAAAVRSSTDGVDCAGPLLRQAAGKALRFSNDSTFRVALFADLHYGEAAPTDWGPAQDDSSDRVMSAVLDKENPDFVIYLGDVITANNLPIPNASLYWDRAISPTRSRGIPWGTMTMQHLSCQLNGFPLLEFLKSIVQQQDSQVQGKKDVVSEEHSALN